MRREQDERTFEETLVRAWAALRDGAQVLRTQEGERLRVVFPGLRNRGPGPDFRRAILATERGRLVRGDVEVHRASSDWRGHGHMGDPRYGRVVLHVVAQDDQGRPTQGIDGARVPVLVFGAGAPQGADAAFSGCGLCRRVAGDLPQVEGLLEAQGWLRFQARLRSWIRRLKRAEGDRTSADQALYEGLMKGLGYPQNRAPFLRLAQALPWKALCGEVRRCAPEARAAAMQTLLLGAAGFLEELGEREPLARPLPLAGETWDGLRGRWRAWGRASVLGRDDWQRWGHRPGAHPWVRLAGAGALLARWLPQGPVAHLLRTGGLLREGGAGRPLRRLFTVSRPEAGLDLLLAPIGGGRADVLVINVALPFLGAWSQMTGERDLWRAVAEAYRRYPGLEPDGLVRRMALGLGLRVAGLKACHQQGLHHLMERYCARGRQRACPLGNGVGELVSRPRGGWGRRPDPRRRGGPPASGSSRRRRSWRRCRCTG